jgi:hypothetical protein
MEIGRSPSSLIAFVSASPVRLAIASFVLAAGITVQERRCHLFRLAGKSATAPVQTEVFQCDPDQRKAIGQQGWTLKRKGDGLVHLVCGG